MWLRDTLLNLIARCRSQEIDEEIVSLARRNFLQRAGSSLTLPLMAPFVADQLIELLQPSSTIFLPHVPDVWVVNSLGGYFYSRQLSNVLRNNIQPLVRFRQFAEPLKFDVRTEKLSWNVYGH